jgi:phenylpropionate dioxygenase-like ring-hydroxylating dioxygenase large terminal subunit
MTLSLPQRQEYLRLVNSEEGVIDRSIFSDPQIYRDEMEQIFARSWLFVAHEVQLPEPGSYVQTRMGADPVIVTRDKQGEYNVLINSCRHRGNAVCKADEGRANSFMCQYHGWTYDLKGRLVGVPGYKEIYYEELKRDDWGLVTAARVESYGGLVFATMAPDAPPLMEYLGEIGKLSIDYFNVAQPKAYTGMFKWSVDCNWKFAVDNIWDWYHVYVTHQSAGRAGMASRNGKNYVERWSVYRKPQREVVALGEYGHAIGGQGWMPPDGSEIAPPKPIEEQSRLGPLAAKMDGFGGIFPNLWLSRNSIEWRLPVSPTCTEMWHINFGPRTGGQGVGPSSMFDQDDAENWIMSTRGTTGVVINRHPLNYQAAIGHGEVIDEEGAPLHMDNKNWTEQGQRWHYQNWANWMAAENWSELKATRPPVPEGIV